MCNVKLELYAKGVACSWGGGGNSKLFFCFSYVEKQKQSFQPIFLNRYLRLIGGKNLLSSPSKKVFSFNFSLTIFMGNPSFRLSEVRDIYFTTKETHILHIFGLLYKLGVKN